MKARRLCNALHLPLNPKADDRGSLGLIQDKIFYDKLSFIFLEMPKFRKREEDLETMFDKWLYVLKNLPNLEKRLKRLQEKVFESVFKAAEIAKYTKEEAMQYEESLKQYRDFNNVVNTAIEEGRIQGRIQGRVEGRVEGKIEGKIEVALNLLKEKIPINTIAKVTGLSVEEIKKLETKHK